MLCLYKHYLQAIRIKKFARYHCFKKCFKQQWMKRYMRQSKLRNVMINNMNKQKFNDRIRYQKEYDLKREVLSDWKERVND